MRSETVVCSIVEGSPSTMTPRSKVNFEGEGRGGMKGCEGTKEGAGEAMDGHKTGKLKVQINKNFK